MPEPLAEVPGRTVSGGWVPIPDPTQLTTDAVNRATEVFHRELASLREILETRIEGNDRDRELLWGEFRAWPRIMEDRLENRRREFSGDLNSARVLIEQRLQDMDKALLVQHQEAERYVTVLMAQRDMRFVAEREYFLSQLEVLSTRMSEKFDAVDEQFTASKTAVDAALSAAKEAVAEQNKANSAAIKVSEGNTKEQLTSLGQVSSANFKAQEDKLNDARDRLTTIESLTRGIKEAGGDDRSDQTLQLTAAELKQTADNNKQTQIRSMISITIATISVLASIIAIILVNVLH